MDWELIGGLAFAAVIIILLVILARRNMTHNYTAGSGMFKNSEDNLEKDKHMDASDYEYFNNDGILK